MSKTSKIPTNRDNFHDIKSKMLDFDTKYNIKYANFEIKISAKIEKRKLPDFVILAGGFRQFFKSNKICFYFVINFIKIIFQLPVIATLTFGFDGTICTRDNTANELFSK